MKTPSPIDGDAPLVTVDGIVKSFNGNEVLHGISLDFVRGEFVGLMGPNGAGKSTLIKILDGVYRPDQGRILIDGRVADQAERARKIGVVHQNLGLVDSMTVWENLCLALPPQYAVRPLLSFRRERELVRHALGQVGLDESLIRKRVGALSLGEKTMVAVARLLARGAELIIVDEVTSALPPNEATWLVDTLRHQARSGSTIVMVSHRLSEIVGAADRQVVIVDGRVVADTRTSLLDIKELTDLMTPEGNEGASAVDSSRPLRVGETVLEMRDAYSQTAGPFNFTVSAGEVVGLTGPIGFGLYSIAYLASGFERARRGAVEMSDRGVGFLPPDRETEGNFDEDPVLWNMTVASLNRFSGPFGLLKAAEERSKATEMHTRLAVVPQDLYAKQRTLSGGNQQKVLFGRALLQGSRLLVLCEPTRGIDVVTRQQIYRLIRDLKSEGHAILIISTDAEDLLSVADRVGIMQGSALPRLVTIDELDLASII